jgi:hypothetical protein
MIQRQRRDRNEREQVEDTGCEGGFAGLIHEINFGISYFKMTRYYLSGKSAIFENNDPYPTNFSP